MIIEDRSPPTHHLTCASSKLRLDGSSAFALEFLHQVPLVYRMRRRFLVALGGCCNLDGLLRPAEVVEEELVIVLHL